MMRRVLLGLVVAALAAISAPAVASAGVQTYPSCNKDSRTPAFCAAGDPVMWAVIKVSPGRRYNYRLEIRGPGKTKNISKRTNSRGKDHIKLTAYTREPGTYRLSWFHAHHRIDRDKLVTYGDD